MKPAHETFVSEYRKTGDPVKSALKAGSPEPRAAADAERWLGKQEIKDAIAAPSEKAPQKRTAPKRRVMRKK